jgi:hypothetical protein
MTRLQHHLLLAPNWHQTERAAVRPQTLTVTTRWSLLVVEPSATTVTTADLNTAMTVNRRASKTLTRAKRTKLAQSEEDETVDEQPMSLPLRR